MVIRHTLNCNVCMASYTFSSSSISLRASFLALRTFFHFLSMSLAVVSLTNASRASCATNRSRVCCVCVSMVSASLASDTTCAQFAHLVLSCFMRLSVTSAVMTNDSICLNPLCTVRSTVAAIVVVDGTTTTTATGWVVHSAQNMCRGKPKRVLLPMNHIQDVVRVHVRVLCVSTAGVSSVVCAARVVHGS